MQDHGEDNGEDDDERPKIKVESEGLRDSDR